MRYRSPIRLYRKRKGIFIMSEHKTWDEYIECRKEVYRTVMPANLKNSLISEANWFIRCKCESADDLGVTVKEGDICYMDFGQAYLNEMGFQHFGLVMSLCRRKALVVPMTSNPVQYKHAYDPVENPRGRKHLMRIGQIEGLNKPSVLFLNDMKFVTTARVIDVKAHISTESALFAQIQERLLHILLGR